LDLPAIMKLDSQGMPEQTIRTIARHPVCLTIKVQEPAQRVYGYLIAQGTTIVQGQSIFAGVRALLASLVDAQEKPKELLLQKFDYADDNRDGIYEAEIYAPAVKGNYQIKTIIEYENNQEEREMNMTLVVDPEGYVYEMMMGRQARVENATVSLYQQNPRTNKYELWPAQDFSQQNPQTTGITGQYSFLAPQGTYHLQVDAPGYRQFKGEAFEIVQNQGVHANIELKPLKAAWWNFDWKFWVLAVLMVSILVVLIILLLRNNNNNQTI